MRRFPKGARHTNNLTDTDEGQTFGENIFCKFGSVLEMEISPKLE